MTRYILIEARDPVAEKDCIAVLTYPERKFVFYITDQKIIKLYSSNESKDLAKELCVKKVEEYAKQEKESSNC